MIDPFLVHCNIMSQCGERSFLHASRRENVASLSGSGTRFHSRSFFPSSLSPIQLTYCLSYQVGCRSNSLSLSLSLSLSFFFLSFFRGPLSATAGAEEVASELQHCQECNIHFLSSFSSLSLSFSFSFSLRGFFFPFPFWGYVPHVAAGQNHCSRWRGRESGRRTYGK
jgi:hypothetical protein